MKSFFEEYGFVILAAIVVIILIAMATPIGDLVKTQIDGVINSFGSKTQSKLNATDGIIQVRVSTANNKITLEWNANKKEDVFKYQYKASNTSKDANWTPVTDIPTGSDKSRKVEITSDSNNQPLANKTKVEYKIYDSNDQLVASGVVTAKVGKNATTGDEGGAEISGITTGKVLTIEGKEYTVIEQVEDNKYKVLATETFKHNFDINSNNYKTSEIATYLDGEYYNSLDASIKSSIVETSIQQKVLKTWNGNNPTDWGTSKDAGIHKVFMPSWDEILKTYGGTSANEVKAYSYCGNTWLRDAYVNATIIFMSVDGHIGGSYHPNSPFFVRPAFVLDLSKVNYTVK